MSSNADNPAVAPPAEVAASEEILQLKARVHRLAEEKSYLQLVLRLIEKLNPLSGMTDMVRNMLNTIVETIGGTNIKLYYWVGEDLHYVDFFSKERIVSGIDDHLAAQVVQSHTFLEIPSDSDQALMIGDIPPGAWVWVFPLRVGKELLGIIKLENVHVSGHSLSRFLPIFFDHVALTLSNEIRNHIRRQAEQALQEKSQELDNYFNNALDLFCIADADGSFRKLNPAWEKTLGYRLSELEGRQFLDYVHPDDIADTIATTQRATQDQVVNFTNRYRHKDGSYRWIEWHSRPHGKVIFAAARDISERKRIERELAEHRDRLAELVEQRTAELKASNNALKITQYTVDHAAWPIFWINPETTRFIYVNDQACKSLGYSQAELLSMAVPDIHPELPPDFWPKIMHKFHTDGSLTFESEHLRKDGTIFPVEISANISDFQGIETIVAFATNITQRKAAEIDLLRAKETAEAANRAKSVFLANMSHELRTPLNAILGFAQLMQRDAALSKEQRNNLSTINRSGQHLLSVINDVLEISRIETGHIRLDIHPFSLTRLLLGIEEMIRVRAETKGISFRLERDQEAPDSVSGDPHKLRQILINLLGNAIKFTADGGVILKVSLENRQDAHVELRFAVEDSGIGIPIEEQALIFEPFTQAKAGELSGEGSGLGLAISREFLQLMDSQLEVESKPGEGSTFRFNLGLQCVDAGEIESRKPVRTVIGLKPGQPNYRILIAEDRVDNRLLLRKLMEQVGLQVREAVNGQEAINQFRSWHPHFIWMDMRMPVVDGYEATRQIKRLPSGQQTPIVALTANAFEEDRDKVLAAGCDGFVRKPLKEEEIFDSLEQLLGVHFSYQQETQTGESDSSTLDPKAIARLPTDLIAALEEAANQLDQTTLEQVNDQIETHDKGLAHLLRELTAGFRFDTIQKALQHAHKLK